MRYALLIRADERLAGLAEVRLEEAERIGHVGPAKASTHVYFSAPGGQVFRLIDMAYDGP